MNAPAHWGQIPTRACNVCSFGRDDQGLPTRPGGRDAVRCICPNVTGRNLPSDESDWPLGVPVTVARANAGPCGPEAHCQAYPGF